MMNLVALFRTFVAGATACYLVWVALPYFDEVFLHPEAQLLMKYDGYHSILGLPSAVSWIFVIVWVGLAIGMFLFLAPARTGYLILVLVFLFLTPLNGLRVQSGLESYFLDAVNILDGVVLAMAYFSKVSQYFQKSTTGK
jgi:hypothetical protein